MKQSLKVITVATVFAVSMHVGAAPPEIVNDARVDAVVTVIQVYGAAGGVGSLSGGGVGSLRTDIASVSVCAAGVGQHGKITNTARINKPVTAIGAGRSTAIGSVVYGC